MVVVGNENEKIHNIQQSQVCNMMEKKRSLCADAEALVTSENPATKRRRVGAWFSANVSPLADKVGPAVSKCLSAAHKGKDTCLSIAHSGFTKASLKLASAVGHARLVACQMRVAPPSKIEDCKAEDAQNIHSSEAVNPVPFDAPSADTDGNCQDDNASKMPPSKSGGVFVDAPYTQTDSEVEGKQAEEIPSCKNTDAVLQDVDSGFRSGNGQTALLSSIETATLLDAPYEHIECVEKVPGGETNDVALCDMPCADIDSEWQVEATETAPPNMVENNIFEDATNADIDSEFQGKDAQMSPPGEVEDSTLHNTPCAEVDCEFQSEDAQEALPDEDDQVAPYEDGNHIQSEDIAHEEGCADLDNEWQGEDIEYELLSEVPVLYDTPGTNDHDETDQQNNFEELAAQDQLEDGHRESDGLYQPDYSNDQPVLQEDCEAFESEYMGYDSRNANQEGDTCLSEQFYEPEAGYWSP